MISGAEPHFALPCGCESRSGLGGILPVLKLENEVPAFRGTGTPRIGMVGEDLLGDGASS